MLLYLGFVFAHVSVQREYDLWEGFHWSVDADWTKLCLCGSGWSSEKAKV